MITRILNYIDEHLVLILLGTLVASTMLHSYTHRQLVESVSINWCVTKHMMDDRYGAIPDHDSYDEWVQIQAQRLDELMTCFGGKDEQ